jgi:uncharacterized membrane protein
MGLLDDTRVKALLAGFLLSLFALVATASLGLLAALSALGSQPAGTPLLFVLLEAAAPYLVASALVSMLSLLLLVALAVAVVRRASMPRDERLARLARTVERHSSGARSVGLAERFEPTTEERIEELKARYVEGEITEWEYERQLQELLADEDESPEDVSDERVQQEREWAEQEGEREFGRET